MRLVIARCQLDYAGRLTADPPMPVRLLLIKVDGSVSVHFDGRVCPGWRHRPLPVQRVLGARGLGGRSLVRGWAR